MSEQLAFTVIFIITVASAAIVAFSRNLIYSAFALIGTFLGVAGTFVLLSAEFVGLVQVMVYAGGILILTVFAVMLTSHIEKSGATNPTLNAKIVVPVIAILVAFLATLLASNKWAVLPGPVAAENTMAGIGNALLTDYLLPFEFISILLLMAMVGAAIITRRHVKG